MDNDKKATTSSPASDEVRGLTLDQLSLFQNFNNEKIVTTAEYYAKHILIIHTGIELVQMTYDQLCINNDLKEGHLE